MTHEDPKHDRDGDEFCTNSSLRDEFARRLDEALDEGRSLDDPQWTELARDDAASRELLEGYRAMSEGMRQRQARPQPRPSADLAARVVAQLRSGAGLEEPVARPISASGAGTGLGGFSRVSMWAAIAAAVLVMVSTYFAVQNPAPTPSNSNLAVQQPVKQPAKQPDSEQIAAKSPKVTTPEKNTPDQVVHQDRAHDPALRSLVAEAGDRYLELAKETRESFADVALLLPGVSSGEPAGATKKQWIDQVGDGLKPVTRSVGGAFDFLLQAIRVEEPRS